MTIKSINLDDRILAKLDYYAEKQGVSRSRLVNLVLAEKLGVVVEQGGDGVVWHLDKQEEK